MTRLIKRKIYIFIAALTMGTLPVSALAAQLQLNSDASGYIEGDAFVVELNLNSSSEVINVVDGTINFDPSKLQVQGVSTGDSIFSLWTRTPVFSNQSGRIFFTGGTPKGFSGSQGQILKIIFTAKAPGAVKIQTTSDSLAYLADGKGTKSSLAESVNQITIAKRTGNSVIRDQWGEILAQDKITPQNLTVKLGQDPSMFDGKYFLSFYATDQGSGLNYYEIKEGKSESARGESPYVLKDQTLNTPVEIIAVDKAGNKTVQQVDPAKLKGQGSAGKTYAFIAIIFLLAIVLLKYRSRKNNKK